MSSISVSTPSDTEIVMSRSFDAPRELVFAAHTQPEHVKHWWGRGNPLDVELDLRVGGRWRFVEHADATAHACRGEYRQIHAPATYTWTFEYEPMAGHIAVEKMEFTEDNGRTTVTSTTRFANQADRDGMLQSGMEQGAGQSYDALEAYLRKIA